MKDEFYSVTFRKNIYTSLEALQIDVNGMAKGCIMNFPAHTQEDICYGKTPLQTFLDSKHIAIENSVISFCGESDSVSILQVNRQLVVTVD